MHKIGVAQWCLDLTGVDAIFRAAQLGFSVVHLQVGEPGDRWFLGDLDAQQLYCQASRDMNIDIAAIALNVLDVYGLTSPPGSHLSTKCSDIIRTGIDAAVAMNVGLVYLPSFQNSEIRDLTELERTAEFLREACVYAEGNDVLVATENTLDMAGNLELLKRVDHPKLRFLLDTLNPILWGHHISDMIRGLWPYMCDQIHAKDGRNSTMGNEILNRGQAGFAETAKLLNDMGFSGCIVLENDYRNDTAGRVALDLSVIRQLFHEDGGNRDF